MLEKEAENVRLIFDLRIKGASLGGISKVLKEKNIKSPTGNDVWSRETINKLLKNEKVCGAVSLQKTFVKDYKTGKQTKNNGELQKVMITCNHEGIISEETFLKVNTNIEW